MNDQGAVTPPEDLAQSLQEKRAVEDNEIVTTRSECDAPLGRNAECLSEGA